MFFAAVALRVIGLTILVQNLAIVRVDDGLDVFHARIADFHIVLVKYC